MQLPREVIVGRDTLKRIPEVLNRLKITGNALIIAGKTSYEIAGEKVRDLISQTGMSVDTFLVKKVNAKGKVTLSCHNKACGCKKNE